ncbi:MAG: ribonuclease P protein component [Candidatus Cardinium sp.]|uniref:ribonuclease P protein component n=1 Tax=Candidatus Cardinium sp. TP TaxID=2961955 RepID=UPI0021AED316|nr:ribonuclease P protein component [Candidatus Cardinium sp. TP]MCT4696826.1 ribonuclease P protein component [Candidatus Cardinium sp. TP]MDN5246834.1 ribonuclease P protein component [Candidatus Cardinium sp.]
MGKNNLSKCHRLTDRKHIQMLFQEGHRFKLHPCSVFYLQKKQEQFGGNQVLFAVSKRHLRSAVQRNKVKRLLREAYRINKYLLDDVLAPTEFAFLIGYVYTGKEEEIHYPILNKTVIRSLQHLSALLSQRLSK